MIVLIKVTVQFYTGSVTTDFKIVKLRRSSWMPCFAADREDGEGWFLQTSIYSYVESKIFNLGQDLSRPKTHTNSILVVCRLPK